MEKWLNIFKIILIVVFTATITFNCFGQSLKNVNERGLKSQRAAINKLLRGKRRLNKESKKFQRESEYYASIRYIIAYNDVFENDERRIEILIDKKKFNSQNLIQIFNLIQKKFPQPTSLEITVHTDLATIETPEEREMERDGNDSRFGSKVFNYRMAHYIRYEDGKAVFTYSVSLFPAYKEKKIFL